MALSVENEVCAVCQHLLVSKVLFINFVLGSEIPKGYLGGDATVRNTNYTMRWVKLNVAVSTTRTKTEEFYN